MNIDRSVGKSSVPRIELLQRFDIVGSEESIRKAARTIGVVAVGLNARVKLCSVDARVTTAEFSQAA